MTRPWSARRHSLHRHDCPHGLVWFRHTHTHTRHSRHNKTLACWPSHLSTFPSEPSKLCPHRHRCPRQSIKPLQKASRPSCPQTRRQVLHHTSPYLAATVALVQACCKPNRLKLASLTYWRWTGSSGWLFPAAQTHGSPGRVMRQTGEGRRGACAACEPDCVE